MTWLVPPQEPGRGEVSPGEATDGDSLDESSLGTLVDSVADGDTVADVLPLDDMPTFRAGHSTPRDVSTRKIDSQSGAFEPMKQEQDEDESEVSLFQRPAPPRPKLSAPSDQVELPVRPDKPEKSSNFGRMHTVVAVLLSAVLGGLLAWFLTS